ncbi:MAG: hypothetical protein ACXAEN_17820 [Candidatus Thorarchaeota archaeon]|jgi:hypothetical protein
MRDRDVINTRNRPKSEKIAEGGIVAAVIEITDACHILELISEYPEFKNNKRIIEALDSAIAHNYQACEMIERVSMKQSSESILPTLRKDTLFEQPPVTPEDGKPYVVGGEVDGKKLYTLAKKVGPWECESAVCWECPKSNNTRLQRRECLDYYLVEQTKQVALDELMAGMPYTRQELRAFARKDLLALCKALKVNSFKLKDRSNQGLIVHILTMQQELQSRQEETA